MNQRKIFFDHLGQTSPYPLALEIAKAKGCYMYDKQDKPYLDLISGIGVSALGHSHPAILEAVNRQVNDYMHLMVYGEFIETPQIILAKALTDTLPGNLNNVFLVNSGSEATEGALKLAKRYTGRSKILSCYNAYHGSTQGALSVCGNESLKNAFRPLLPNTYLFRFGIEDDLELIDNTTAAVIIETIQGEAGVRISNEAYFEALAERCKKAGCLLILDEIQCGMGRTGKLWAFEHFKIRPDILLTAKGLGGGMPIGAFISSKEIMSVLTNSPILGHITTFGGHPVSAAAANATLTTIIKSGMLDEATQKGELIKSLLTHERIKDVRGIGLMIAVEFESYEILAAIIQELLQMGILSDWFLFCDNSMRVAPPLIISEQEIKMACNQILQAIDNVYKK